MNPGQKRRREEDEDDMMDDDIDNKNYVDVEVSKAFSLG